MIVHDIVNFAVFLLKLADFFATEISPTYHQKYANFSSILIGNYSQ